MALAALFLGDDVFGRAGNRRAGKGNGGEGGGNGKWQSHFGFSGLTWHKLQAMTKLFPGRSG
jgi:hypothetical protein